ncbi:tyrosine-type recombinase/integrase, partial [Salibacteraceae bacterium]|nr:tyrosine-type recombinase/integrase [Salibacteraceae bacterium]
SETALEVLKKYVIEYKPTHFLFEGKPGNKYSSTSVAKIVQQASEKAQIPMKVTPHILRHSFATHLMDQGIETRYIQILLGHESLNTTAIYAHVSTKSLNSISSPLDRLNNHNQLNINNLNKNDKKG